MNTGWLRSRARRPSEQQQPHPNGNGVPELRPRSATAASSLPTGRPSLLRPLPLIGLALVLIALLGFLSAYSHASKRTRILVAARDLPAGTLLHASDLASTSIAGDRTLLASLVGSGERSRVLGRRLATPLLAGAPLPRAAVVAPAQVPDSLTLAVPALHALAGGLVAGDRVTVLATFDNGAGHAQTRAVARGLEVLAVGRPPSTIDPSTATVPVTLALTQPALASTLALANNEGRLDLLREGSSSQTAPIPAAATPTR